MKKLILVLAIALAATGCKKKDADETPAEATAAVEQADSAAEGETQADDDAADATADADAADADSPTSLLVESLSVDTKVHAQGAEPRQVLRLRLADAKPVVMEAVTEMSTSAMGQKMELPRMLGEITLSDLEMRGENLYYVMQTAPQTFEERLDTDAHKALTEAMRAGADMTVMRAGVTMRNDGQVVDIEVLDHAGDLTETLESLSKNLSNMASSLPTEPVGVGARWTTRTSMELGEGMNFDVEVTVELIDLTAEAATMNLTLNAPNLGEALNAQVAAEGGGANVASAQLAGTGRSVMRFDSIFPDTEQDMKMTMTLEAGGNEILSEMEMKMVLRQKR